MKQANPNLNHYQILDIMRNTAKRNLPDAAVNKGGLIDAFRAVETARNLR